VVALGTSSAEAYEKAFNADSVSAFGGIVALNRPIDASTATALTQTFFGMCLAPACRQAEEILR